MMCCARWLFARRCKLDENLHQSSRLSCSSFQVEKRPWSKTFTVSVNLVLSSDQMVFFFDRCLHWKVRPGPLPRRKSWFHATWLFVERFVTNPRFLGRMSWKSTCRRKIHQTIRKYASGKCSCPKSAQTPHANTHPKMTTPSLLHGTIMAPDVWLSQSVWTCLDNLNFSNVNYVVYSPRTMKVRKHHRRKEILSNNEGNVKIACACMTQCVAAYLRWGSLSPHVASILFLTSMSLLQNSKHGIKV